jgi:predicted DNA-binding transcriptional regulator AlpA
MEKLESEVYTLKEFLLAHKIGRTTFYRLMKKNKAPDVLQMEGKVLITKKAAEEWRERMTKKA